MNMPPLKVLDVTLRDGGHLNDFHFTEAALHAILSPLNEAGIDYIEVGYRNGSIVPIPNIGIAGMSPDAYLTQCKALLTRTHMAVMAHCENIDKNDIIALKKNGVDLLRLCIPKGDAPLAIPLIQYAQDAGLLVSLNFIHMSQYTPELLYETVDKVMPFKPDMIYFADSNGCMHPNRTHDIYTYCTQHYTIPFGFHGHDNLGLAQANTLAAMQAGAHYIDGSLAGAGKGIGNLKLEFIIAYLHSLHNHQYNLNPLIEASNYIRNLLPQCGHVSEDEFTRGIRDLSTKQLKEYNAAKKPRPK